MSSTSEASGALRSLKERIIRLEEDKRALQADIKEVYLEAKASGFDTKALRLVVKRAMETTSEAAARRETQAIAELYLASLGMLDGTPLGDATRERMMPPPPEPEKNDEGDDGGAPAPDSEAEEPQRGTFSDQDISEARGRGEQDCAAGKRIIDNPYVAGDPRRAAWDEGHCRRSGSDGMEVPEAWRRRQKPKADTAAKEAA